MNAPPINALCGLNRRLRTAAAREVKRYTIGK